jgi:mono/diheme cytochrome c family protein
MRRLVLALGLGALACTGKYVRPTTQETVKATPERLARGEYIVDRLASCGACHTERQSGDASDSESATAGAYLSGGNTLRDAQFTLWVPNITGDLQTGIGRWTDDELMRAIRDGVRPDGSFMFPVMPYLDYRFMSDEDVRAVVAYLRSVPKVKQPRKPTENDLPFLAKVGIGLGMVQHEPAKDVPPPPDDPVRRGEYLAHLGHCQSCHALGSRGPRDPDDDDFMAGSDKPMETPGLAKVWAPNLTPDRETGLGRFSDEQLENALRTGTRLSDGKPMAYPMSAFIPHLAGISAQDMSDLIAWLRSLKPVKHAVPPRELTAKGQQRFGG